MNGTDRPAGWKAKYDDDDASAGMKPRNAIWHALVDLNGDAVYMIDVEGVVLAANRTLTDRLGIDFSTLIGAPIYRFLPGDLAEFRRSQVEAAARARKPLQFEDRREDRVVDNRIYPIIDKDGTVRRLAVRSVDITEITLARKRQAKLAAQKAQAAELLELILNRMPMGCFVVSPDFTFGYINPAAESIFGFPQNEILGKSPYETIVPESARPIVEDIEHRLYQGAMDAHSINDNITRDGRIITCEWNNIPMIAADGTFHGYISMVQDVSERENTRIALQEAQAMLRLVLDTIPVRVFWKDTASNYLGCNKLFARDAGLDSVEDIVGRTDFEMPWKKEAERYRTDDAAVIRSGRARLRYEEPQTRRGKRFYLRTSKVPLRSSSNDIIGMLGTYEDITREKQSELLLRQQQKMEDIGFLASGIAHEVSNPIMGISGYAQLIEESAHTDSRIIDFARKIQRETSRVHELIMDLLSFARKEKKEKTATSPHHMIHGVIPLVKTVMRKDDIILDIDVSQDLPLVGCNRQQIQQVILNLLTNARDALNEAPPRGKRIRVAAEAVKKGLVRISVTDNGTGVPPSIAERIFDPFFSTKETGKGTGLGLSISYGIVAEHGGRLYLDTTYTNGARFVFNLPVAVAKNAG